MELMKKQISHAFGKDIYLLGRFEDGKRFWLERASWDCDWYWGFGYIETYTNNTRPDKARDIDSHQHYDSLCFKKAEVYDFKTHRVEYGEYMHTLYDNPNIIGLTISKHNAWVLSDLMHTFYTLKETAALFHRGNSHCTTVPGFNLKDEQLAEHINKSILPQVFDKIYELLTP